MPTHDPTHLDERLVHIAMVHLLPTTLDYHDNNQQYEPTSWIESCDALGEWEDREGCSTDYLMEMDDYRSQFAEMDYGSVARYTAAAMRLIREMGYDRAALAAYDRYSDYLADGGWTV